MQSVQIQISRLQVHLKTAHWQSNQCQKCGQVFLNHQQVEHMSNKCINLLLAGIADRSLLHMICIKKPSTKLKNRVPILNTTRIMRWKNNLNQRNSPQFSKNKVPKNINRFKSHSVLFSSKIQQFCKLIREYLVTGQKCSSVNFNLKMTRRYGNQPKVKQLQIEAEMM
ncbi:Hypothetical_protein [Hexamita inflata]|uniref:Hypothetical_protein n=1 Tax=Hexamita inflata TaxID=28002 RepID=A0AA86UC36_9EUKA|nr:Hypothetical protein HINF_LOCUS32927 [Hexamita inflata]